MRVLPNKEQIAGSNTEAFSWYHNALEVQIVGNGESVTRPART
jgi:hypothetical protein